MRLIDADNLEECKEVMTTIHGECKYAVRMDDIRKMPTITVERPHGEWKQITAKDGEYYCYHKCTNCGQTIESGFDNPPIFNFCPNCGADMREGESN